jgi:DNA-binding NtrC family response regulator
MQPPADPRRSPLGGWFSLSHKMNKRILLADDDQSVRKALKKVLEEADYEILEAIDGEDAERRFTSEPIDLLLLDLDLPKQNGWNVFGLINSQNPLLPIVIISGLKDQADTELIPGVSAFLEKPIDVPLLLKTIEALLEEPAEARLQKITYHLQRSQPVSLL